MSDVVTAAEDVSRRDEVRVARDPRAVTIRVSVAVVESNDPIRDRIQTMLGGAATPFNTLEELTARLTGTVPVVVVLGPSCSDDATLELSERIISQYPLVASILVANELTTALLQKALRSGVRDVLALNGEPTAASQAVQRLAIALDQTMRTTSPVAPPAAPTHTADTAPSTDVAQTGDAGPSGYPGDQPQQNTPAVTDPGAALLDGQPGTPGEVITVFSTKGGAGKSVVATSLAVALAQRSEGPVCLVDADLQFGDVAVMLKLTPHHTIVDVVSSLDRLDPALLHSLLVTHEPTGLLVMPAPLEPAFADQVGAVHMNAIIDQLRTFCSYVVVDTPSYFNDVVLGLVETSDKILLVAGLDIPNVKNVKIALQTLRLLNTPPEKLMLVLNRANSKVKLDIGEVERTLQIKADAMIPSEIVVPQAVNKGEPVVTHAPKSAVAKSLQGLSELFLPQKARRRR